jgi:hypothetical protein
MASSEDPLDDIGRQDAATRAINPSASDTAR